MKKILRFIIRFILKLIPAVICAAGVFVYLTIHYTLLSEGPGQDIGFEYIEREIYVNGCHIYNFQLTHPIMKGIDLTEEVELFGRPSKEDDQVTLLDEEEEPEPGKPVNTFKVAAAENFLRTDLDADNLFIPLDSSFQDMLGIQILTRGDLVQIIRAKAQPYHKPGQRDYIAEKELYFTGTPYIDIDAVLCKQFMNKGSLDLSDSQDRLRYYINNYLADHFERYEDRRQEEVFIELSSKDFYWCKDSAADTDYYVPLDEDRPGQLLYVRLSALEAVPEFGISSYYDPISGIYISSFADKTAEEMYKESGNPLYISGRAEYMKHIQRRLDTNTAYYMEYLFRKYAVFNDLDEELLIGLCRTESAYTLELHSTAIGIMQLMPNTVRGWGWTVEDVQSLEGNISFGSMYIKYMIDQFGGDRVRALSAYNKGIGRVRGGSYETWYASRVLDYRQNIINWCEENGYSTEFLDVVYPELFEELPVNASDDAALPAAEDESSKPADSEELGEDDDTAPRQHTED
ncbi:MAG: transglycosylase SLT domain-containing protein [Firmicutes bacterium]|nr:transglycosylase SLT domain-containing protein [Bacillota bacterium]